MGSRLREQQPDYLKERHGLPQEVLQDIALVETLAAKAAGIAPNTLSQPTAMPCTDQMERTEASNRRDEAESGLPFHEPNTEVQPPDEVPTRMEKLIAEKQRGN